MEDILDADLAEIATAIRDQRVKSVDITRGFLDRIEKVNPALNAVVYSMADQAMKMAQHADLRLKQGELDGILHGVPITMKDSLDTIDGITTWGTLGRAEVRPGQDATCVARLRQQGAIIMGKTNTPEFTLAFVTDNSVYGRTNNPWNTDHTPGGSSGGAAAIIAAGASPLDMGTDTAGSIRLPANFCGITGIKPTTGRIPCTGNALPISGLIAPLSQPGPMARSVNDLIYVLPILSGPDLIDPHAVNAELKSPDNVVLADLRVGYHSDNGICTPDAAVADAVEQVTLACRSMVATVAEARPSGIEMSRFILGRVFEGDDGDLIEMLLEDSRTDQPSPQLARQLERPRGGSARELAQVISLWHNYQSSMLSYFNDFDVLICPAHARTAYRHDENANGDAYSYTSAYNLAGWPGVVIPVGLDSNGLPVGIQILAQPFREDICLAIARSLETALGFDSKPAIHASR